MLAPRRSNARRMGSSSLVHTFRPSSSTSPATRIISRAQTLSWQRTAPGAESSVSISPEAARLEPSLSWSWATPNHASFDNLTFVDDKDTILVTEDRGDTLHDQLNRLDSIWAYKLNSQHPDRNLVTRFLALGQDQLATDEDNE